MRDELGQLAERVLTAHPLDGGRVQAVFTTDEHMARMNEQFRGKAMTTDVLSFDYGQPESTDADDLENEVLEPDNDEADEAYRTLRSVLSHYKQQ